MSTALESKKKQGRYRVGDPYSLARSFLGFDPFFAVGERMAKSGFVPTFEAKETDGAYVISADVPGVKEDDLDISLHNNVLTISGSKSAEERKEGDTYFVYERQYGNFSRSFSLPDEANTNAVEAALIDGVLTVKIGKKAESKPKKISLKK